MPRGGSGPPKRERPGLAQPGALEIIHNRPADNGSVAKLQRVKRRQKAAWGKSLRRIAEEAGGLYRVELVRPGAPRRPPGTLLALRTWFDDLAQGVQLRPVCAFCNCVFRWPQILPGALLVFSPDTAAATHAVCGICKQHAAVSDDALMEKALVFVRATIMADARKLNPANIISDGGHA